MSVQTDYYIPQLQKADEQISKQASEITRLRTALEEAAQRLDARGHKFGAEQARAAIAPTEEAGGRT